MNTTQISTTDWKADLLREKARREAWQEARYSQYLQSKTERGVRGICGHIAKSADNYCGNPRCCPWAW